MLALQGSIGALNDALDAPTDSGRKPGKPIPRGHATSAAAIVLAAALLAVGVVLSAPSGAPTVLVAIGGVACGYAYDLGLGRTALSWLPLVVALPLLPIHAWLGATGSLPPGLVALGPAAALAGAALAIANALVDLERDLAGRRPTIVVQLGRRRAWFVHALLLLAFALVAIVAAPRGTGPPVGGLSVGGVDVAELALATGFVLIGIGAALTGAAGPTVRERGWELEAVGVAGVGLGWLAGAGGLAS